MLFEEFVAHKKREEHDEERPARREVGALVVEDEEGAEETTEGELDKKWKIMFDLKEKWVFGRILSKIVDDDYASPSYHEVREHDEVLVE